MFPAIAENNTRASAYAHTHIKHTQKDINHKSVLLVTLAQKTVTHFPSNTHYVAIMFFYR